MAKQVKNGKAFEYAIASVFYDSIKEKGLEVRIIEDNSYHVAQKYFYSFDEKDQMRYMLSAQATLDTMFKIEPGLTAQKNKEDVLTIRLAQDREGKEGDVRDVIFTRNSPHWEIGFSAKNNNESNKHSRLSNDKDEDFAKKWFGLACSQQYWDEIVPIFDFVNSYKIAGKKWVDMGIEKEKQVYIPLLRAFKNELLHIYSENPDLPQKLISYIIGAFPFYQIIKEDHKNLVVVKAFNLINGLNRTVNHVKSRYKIPKLLPPTRIVEFDFAHKPANQLVDTLDMILDKGWEISFRIHSADNPLRPSLKFDTKLIGNPPILFTQHLFQ